jgi:hypothetical protein
MGFYDNPLVISGNSQEELRSGGNQLYTPSELYDLSQKYDISNGDDGNNPFKSQIKSGYGTLGTRVENPNFYTDPKTGNIYSNKEYDFANGQVKYTPYLETQAVLNDPLLQYSAIQSGNNAEYLKSLIDLKNTDKNAYYNSISNDINELIYGNYISNRNHANAPLFAALESIKSESPSAYYNAQLKYLGEQLGWQHGQNTYGNTGPVQEEIQRIIPEAQKAGLSSNEINNLLGGSFASASSQNQNRIATEGATGGSGFNFGKDIAPGLMFVGSSLLGAYGIDSALAAGAAAEAAGAGAGAMGPTYAELGYTGLEGGFAGPTYGELGYTGLNQAEAIAAADAASQGLTGQDALNYINNAKKAYDTTNSLSKLLGGSGNTAGVKGATGIASNAANYNPQQMASLLGSSLPTQAAPGGLYKMNENPFNFGTQGQTIATPGTYDVSGTNPMANALRKA